MKRIFGLILAATLAVPAFAQTAPPAAKPAPQLSEVEKLKLENIQLKFSVLQTQEQKLQQEYQAEISAIVTGHPGYTWNAQTSSLVEIPKAAPSK